jgi:hypothetical protein
MRATIPIDMGLARFTDEKGLRVQTRDGLSAFLNLKIKSPVRSKEIQGFESALRCACTIALALLRGGLLVYPVQKCAHGDGDEVVMNRGALHMLIEEALQA